MVITSNRNRVKLQEGFTLMESVVAMSLFVIVIIALISSMSSFLFSTKYSVLQQAFVIAQNELSSIKENEEFSERKIVGKFSVEKIVFKKNKYSEILISVALIEKPEKTIIAISRILILPQ